MSVYVNFEILAWQKKNFFPFRFIYLQFHQVKRFYVYLGEKVSYLAVTASVLFYIIGPWPNWIFSGSQYCEVTSLSSFSDTEVKYFHQPECTCFQSPDLLWLLALGPLSNVTL